MARMGKSQLATPIATLFNTQNADSIECADSIDTHLCEQKNSTVSKVFWWWHLSYFQWPFTIQPSEKTAFTKNTSIEFFLEISIQKVNGVDYYSWKQNGELWKLSSFLSQFHHITREPCNPPEAK